MTMKEIRTADGFPRKNSPAEKKLLKCVEFFQIPSCSSSMLSSLHSSGDQFFVFDIFFVQFFRTLANTELRFGGISSSLAAFFWEIALPQTMSIRFANFCTSTFSNFFHALERGFQGFPPSLEGVETAKFTVNNKST